MANYTAEDVQTAVQAGLISPEDGESLMGGLDEGVPWGQIAGGAAGAALGGAALGKLGGMAGKKLASSAGQVAEGVAPTFGQKAAAAANNYPPFMSGAMTNSAIGAGALGAGAGGMA